MPHDILRVLGVEELANYLVNEIQDVYRLQGVKINDKHIEVIARQMMQKVEILDAGDTDFIAGEQVDRDVLETKNKEVSDDGKKPAKFISILNGITKAFVIPFRIEINLAGFFPSSETSLFLVSRTSLSTCSPAIKSVSPASNISTFCIICLAITSICLSLILTPCNLYTSCISFTK